MSTLNYYAAFLYETVLCVDAICLSCSDPFHKSIRESYGVFEFGYYSPSHMLASFFRSERSQLGGDKNFE